MTNQLVARRNLSLVHKHRFSIQSLMLVSCIFAGCADDAADSVPADNDTRTDVDAELAGDVLELETDDFSSANDLDDTHDGEEEDVTPAIDFSGYFHMQNRFLRIAHRGGGKIAPEETLVAYENALLAGADVIECDVHATSDGVLVCMHDDTVDRTTDGTGPIRSMTFAEFSALDVGYSFSPDGIEFPYRGQNLRAATLDEFLAYSPTAGLAIEIKQASPSIAAAVVAKIVQYDVIERSVVASFIDSTIAEVRKADERILTALAVGEMLAFSSMTEEQAASYRPPGLVIQTRASSAIDANFLARARSFGMKVQVWTVNVPDEYQNYCALGVDGIFSDDPNFACAPR